MYKESTKHCRTNKSGLADVLMTFPVESKHAWRGYVLDTKYEVTKAGWGTRIYNKLFVIKHTFFFITFHNPAAMQQDSHGLNEPGWFICLHWAQLYWFQVTWLADFRSCSGDYKTDGTQRQGTEKAAFPYNEFHTSSILT